MGADSTSGQTRRRWLRRHNGFVLGFDLALVGLAMTILGAIVVLLTWCPECDMGVPEPGTRKLVFDVGGLLVQVGVPTAMVGVVRMVLGGTAEAAEPVRRAGNFVVVGRGMAVVGAAAAAVGFVATVIVPSDPHGWEWVISVWLRGAGLVELVTGLLVIGFGVILGTIRQRGSRRVLL